MAKPLQFNNLSLDDNGYDHEDLTTQKIGDSDTRLMEMLAAQAAHREIDSLGTNEDDTATDHKLSDTEKKNILQRNLNMAASNGDVQRVRKLVEGKAKQYVDVNMPDEEGTAPLIYASCFVS